MSAQESLLLGNPSDRELTERYLDPMPRSPRVYGALLTLAGAGTLVLFISAIYAVITGVGTWGNNVPVGWGFPIISFVWWIGIGHAGTFISAILLLLEQPWRTSINRIAETMTLFALVQAGLYPLLHLGRAWYFYWLIPYPSTTELWPQFMSSLTWDVAAVTTYSLVSLMFWYLGMIPDLASMRDRAKTRWKQIAYGVFAAGWRGSARHWRNYKSAQLLLAGLATPLVLSVHSIVSLDFTIGILPGWHSTIFPPYFVAGAIFSGFAMVLTLVIPMRRLLGLEQIITKRHLDLMAKMMLATGLIVAYTYIHESFIAWYSGKEVERRMLLETRPFGPYAWLYWSMIFCNTVLIQLLWFRKFRRHAGWLFLIAALANVGMWIERLVLVVTSQHRDFLPSSWDMYYPSVVDGLIFTGTICFFTLLFLVAIRVLPFIPISELKEMKREVKGG